MSDTLYVVMSLHKKAPVRVLNCEPPLTDDLPLRFADGMVGILPVFDNKDDAEKYADGSEILEILV